MNDDLFDQWVKLLKEDGIDFKDDCCKICLGKEGELIACSGEICLNLYHVECLQHPPDSSPWFCGPCLGRDDIILDELDFPVSPSVLTPVINYEDDLPPMKTDDDEECDDEEEGSESEENLKCEEVIDLCTPEDTTNVVKVEGPAVPVESIAGFSHIMIGQVLITFQAKNDKLELFLIKGYDGLRFFGHFLTYKPSDRMTLGRTGETYTSHPLLGTFCYRPTSRTIYLMAKQVSYSRRSFPIAEEWTVGNEKCVVLASAAFAWYDAYGNSDEFKCLKKHEARLDSLWKVGGVFL